MRLSTKGQYAVRAIVTLSCHESGSPVTLKAISEEEGISLSYLEQLFVKLRRGDIVRSVRGPGGGYILAKPPGQVKVSECFQCLEGPVITTECVEDESYCERTVDCVARQVWIEVQEAVMGVLQSMTLQNLVDRAKKNKSINYHI